MIWYTVSMQTFLPYSDFKQTATVIDNKRLGKQRVEAMQIFGALERTSGGWVNHPAVVMWRNYEYQLARYGIAICNEWVARGFNDNLTPFFWDKALEFEFLGHTAVPWWLGNTQFHTSHQSNLIRKLPDHYGPLFPGVPDNIPYWWPTQNNFKNVKVLHA